MSIRSSLVALTIPMAVACGAATPAPQAPDADTAAVPEEVTEQVTDVAVDAVVEEATTTEEAAPAEEEPAEEEPAAE